jgi:hypothetical protein
MIDFLPYYASAVIMELWKEKETNRPYIRFYYQRDEEMARQGVLWDNAEITNILEGCDAKEKCYRDVCGLCFCCIFA